VSKLFTWTAVMQQVEAGKIDLNADVNKYIDFKIPPYQGKPVTMLNLMTHTPGFEEAVKDLITLDTKDQVQFDALLKRWVPKRIYAPGTTPAYSNYGASLAGYIVQRVSGMPFDTYLERNIFTPLGMAHSTFRQPLPANLKPLMAEGYISGKDKPYGYEIVSAAPAGALAATGEDMGRFMIAHLQNGQYQGKAILQPATAQLMHSRANTPFQGLDGMAHGFYETNINGMRVIAHGGDTVAFHSDLHLFLDKNVGIFVSMNSAGKDGAAQPLRGALFENFADRYFPEPANAVKADPRNAKEDAEKLAGTYSTTRGSATNFLAVADLIGQTKVSVGEDGNPVVAGAEGLNSQPRKWVHVGPMLWRDANGHDLLGANVADGKATRFSYGELAPIIDFDRTPGYRSSGWILPLLYGSLGILLLTVLLWPTRALVRRKYKSALALEGRQLWSYRSSRIAAIAILAVLGGWVWGLSMLFGDLANEASFNSLLLLLELLSIVVFIGGLAVMIWYAYTAWRSGWRWPGKVWSVLLVIAAGMIVYVGLVFKLIGFTTNY
jgi:CubicO group peptidase (beta-lactamase class C family)